MKKESTHEFRLSLDDLILRINIVVSDIDDALAVGFLLGMGLAELGGNFLDFLSNFEGLIHDFNQAGTFGTHNQTEFDVIFLLFVFIFN